MGNNGIKGRSGPLGKASLAQEVRVKEKSASVRPTVGVTTGELRLRASTTAFKSEVDTDDNYSATRGYDKGVRHNVSIFPTTNAVWARFFHTEDTNPTYTYIPADQWFHSFNKECTDIGLSSAESTAQSQVITAVADVSSSLNNKYFYMYARNNTTGIETVIGVWFNVGSAGTQPTDSLVDQWSVVAISANDTNSTVATALEAVIESITIGGGDVFDSSVSTAAVTVVHDTAAGYGGSQRIAADSTAAPTGFTFAAATAGGAATSVSVFVV